MLLVQYTYCQWSTTCSGLYSLFLCLFLHSLHIMSFKIRKVKGIKSKYKLYEISGLKVFSLQSYPNQIIGLSNVFLYDLKEKWVYYMMTSIGTYLTRNRVPNFSINFFTKQRMLYNFLKHIICATCGSLSISILPPTSLHSIFSLCQQ